MNYINFDNELERCSRKSSAGSARTIGKSNSLTDLERRRFNIWIGNVISTDKWKVLRPRLVVLCVSPRFSLSIVGRIVSIATSRGRFIDKVSRDKSLSHRRLASAFASLEVAEGLSPVRDRCLRFAFSDSTGDLFTIPLWPLVCREIFVQTRTLVSINDPCFISKYRARMAVTWSLENIGGE